MSQQVCPKCGSIDLEALAEARRKGRVAYPKLCLECGHVWTDFDKLGDQKKPKPKKKTPAGKRAKKG